MPNLMAAAWNSGETPGSTNFWYPEEKSELMHQHSHGPSEATRAAQLWKWRVIKAMGSSDHRLFNFLQLRMPIQQKEATRGDVVLTEHIFVKHHQRQLTSPRLVGTSALPVPFHLYAQALWMIPTWIRRKLFVSEICRQPFVESNVLSGGEKNKI